MKRYQRKKSCARAFMATAAASIKQQIINARGM